MNELNELQNIWKTGKREKKELTSVNVPESLVEKLKKLENNQNRINRLKVLVLIMIFTELVYVLNRFDAVTPVAYAGLGMILLGVSAFMFYYFKNQFNIKHLDFKTSSVTFTGDAIRMLQKQNSIFKAPFLVLSVCTLIGANIILLGFKPFSEERIIMHAIYSIIIVISAFLGYRIRLWRIKKEVLTVIRDLQRTNDNLNRE
jgi:hypothetical protein